MGPKKNDPSTLVVDAPKPPQPPILFNTTPVVNNLNNSSNISLLIQLLQLAVAGKPEVISAAISICLGAHNSYLTIGTNENYNTSSSNFYPHIVDLYTETIIKCAQLFLLDNTFDYTSNESKFATCSNKCKFICQNDAVGKSMVITDSCVNSWCKYFTNLNNKQILDIILSNVNDSKDGTEINLFNIVKTSSLPLSLLESPNFNVAVSSVGVDSSSSSAAYLPEAYATNDSVSASQTFSQKERIEANNKSFIFSALTTAATKTNAVLEWIKKISSVLDIKYSTKENNNYKNEAIAEIDVDGEESIILRNLKSIFIAFLEMHAFVDGTFSSPNSNLYPVLSSGASIMTAATINNADAPHPSTSHASVSQTNVATTNLNNVCNITSSLITNCSQGLGNLGSSSNNYLFPKDYLINILKAATAAGPVNELALHDNKSIAKNTNKLIDVSDVYSNAIELMIYSCNKANNIIFNNDNNLIQQQDVPDGSNKHSSYSVGGKGRKLQQSTLSEPSLQQQEVQLTNNVNKLPDIIQFNSSVMLLSPNEISCIIPFVAQGLLQHWRLYALALKMNENNICEFNRQKVHLVIKNNNLNIESNEGIDSIRTASNSENVTIDYNFHLFNTHKHSFVSSVHSKYFTDSIKNDIYNKISHNVTVVNMDHEKKIAVSISQRDLNTYKRYNPFYLLGVQTPMSNAFSPLSCACTLQQYRQNEEKKLLEEKKVENIALEKASAEAEIEIRRKHLLEKHRLQAADDERKGSLYLSTVHAETVIEKLYDSINEELLDRKKRIILRIDKIEKALSFSK